MSPRWLRGIVDLGPPRGRIFNPEQCVAMDFRSNAPPHVIDLGLCRQHEVINGHRELFLREELGQPARQNIRDLLLCGFWSERNPCVRSPVGLRWS